jgi:hypothetical protein
MRLLQHLSVSLYRLQELCGFFLPADDFRHHLSNLRVHSTQLLFRIFNLCSLLFRSAIQHVPGNGHTGLSSTGATRALEVGTGRHDDTLYVVFQAE